MNFQLVLFFIILKLCEFDKLSLFEEKKAEIYAESSISSLSYGIKISKAILPKFSATSDDFYVCFERYCRSIPQLTAIAYDGLFEKICLCI